MRGQRAVRQSAADATVFETRTSSAERPVSGLYVGRGLRETSAPQTAANAAMMRERPLIVPLAGTSALADCPCSRRRMTMAPVGQRARECQ
jgi:hypothetical protein